MNARRLGLIICLAFAAAIAGVVIGKYMFPTVPGAGTSLHDVLHSELDLDARQSAHIEMLEQKFAVRRQALEMELRADNAKLAEAIEAEHGYGPRVAAAVDRSHQAMGELQKETLSHVFAMRQVLRPDQTKKFDRAVVRALTDHVK